MRTGLANASAQSRSEHFVLQHTHNCPDRCLLVREQHRSVDRHRGSCAASFSLQSHLRTVPASVPAAASHTASWRSTSQAQPRRAADLSHIEQQSRLTVAALPAAQPPIPGLHNRNCSAASIKEVRMDAALVRSGAFLNLNKYKGVLFDVDGTLTHSDDLHFEAFVKLLQDKGYNGAHL